MYRGWTKEPKWLTSNVASTPGYLYHGTSDALAGDISKFGLKTFLPNYRDPSRETWADGSMDARAYFTNKAEEVWKFVRGLPGRPVLLRTRATGEFQHEEGPLYYLERRLLPREIEILANNNRWYGLFDFYNSLITESATAEEIHAAAHEAQTSHLNDLPEPTEGQIKAGNYKKGHIRLHGLEISIENPKGSTRKGIDPDGTPWETVLPAHYGDVCGTLASDGDPCDVYVGDHPESERVFVVDQIDPRTGKFDEHKSLMGCLDLEEARTIYCKGFSDGSGPERIGAITEVPLSDFKAWLRTHKTKKPMSRILESAGEPWQSMILDATSFDEIQAAFSLKWPDLGIIRLTNNSESDNHKASTDKEGAMVNRRIFKFGDFANGDEYTIYISNGLGAMFTLEIRAADGSLLSRETRKSIDPLHTIIANHDLQAVHPSAEVLDAKLKEWEQAHSRKGAPTLQASRVIDALLRSGIARNEFKVETEIIKGGYGDVLVKGLRSNRVFDNTESLLRNGFDISWYVLADAVTAILAKGNIWHSAESHLGWAGKPGTLSVVNVVGFDKRDPGHTKTFGPDQMEEARALVTAIQKPQEATPSVPKSPKTGPQRVAALRSMAADIPGLQDYLDKMDAATTKRELRDLDNQKYELIPGLRGSKIEIGGLALYWTVADLRDIKEREINKRLKEEAQSAKVKVEREKQEKKDREDLQLKRYKARPELKKVLDLISADFRKDIIEGVTTRYTRMVEQYFTDNVLNLKRPERGANEWVQRAYSNTMADLAPFMVPSGRGVQPTLNAMWESILERLAKETADYWIEQFESKTAWKLGEVLERKGGGEVSLSGNVHEHAIRMTFPDNSGFTMKTQQVFAVSPLGKFFSRYPTTFHNVLFPNGDKMSTPSAEKMQKEFGIDTATTGEV